MNEFKKLIHNGWVEIDTDKSVSFELAIEIGKELNPWLKSQPKLSKESVSEDNRFILINMEDERYQVEMRKGMTYFYNPTAWRVKMLEKEDKDLDTPSPMEVISRAEVLMAMDILMNHLNDEDDQTDWLVNGVPDGAPPLRMTHDHLEYYSQFVDDFEEIVRVFARTVRRVCFKTTYEPKGFC